jgi:3-hydroxymyristoyl/3-hydroxydecanoyl-(acyl carrier protein) dehydratase
VRFTDDIRRDASGRSARASLFVDPQADYLDDHFPGDPTLPGLVMLETAVRAAAAAWSPQEEPGMPGATLDRVDRLQVMRRVVPGETLVVTAEIAEPLADETTQMFTAMGVVAGETAMRARFRLRRFDGESKRSGR